MKQKVLNILRESSDYFISGEEISKNLQISRTAVWKHICVLRDDGYKIDSRPRQGYRLLKVPDRLYPQEINVGLKTRVLGRNIFYYPEVLSTNQVAKELAGDGCAEGTVVLAEKQSGGRGRMGRTWFSPFGSINLSVVLRPKLNPVFAPQLPLVTGLAVGRAIFGVTGLKPGLKWPNDVLLEGLKTAGILVEMNAELDRINYLVIGIGINVNITESVFPDFLKDYVTSILSVSGRWTERCHLVRVLLEELENSYFQWKEHGFVDLKEAWKKWSVTLNNQVKITCDGKVFSGEAVDIGDDGALIVVDKTGEPRSFYAGEVTLRQK